MTQHQHRRAPARRAFSRPARLTGAVSGLVLALLAGFLLLVPASPGWSATYSGTLTQNSRTGSHTVNLAAGTLRAELDLEPSVPSTGDNPVTASIRLTTPDGRSLAFRYGPGPVVLETQVDAGQYQLVVATSWPLRSRDVDYDLDVDLVPGNGPANPGPTSPTAPSTPTNPSTPTPTGPPATQQPSTPSSTPTSPSTSPPTTPPTTPPTVPAAGTNTAAVCGTWVLYQVDSVSTLRTLRPKIEAALALPGVTGFSVRFPWDAADLTGGQTSNALLDEAYDITQKAGKALSIRFMAGAHTPKRVFDAGAASYNVGGNLVPLPWDAASGKTQVFLDEYAAYAGKLASWSRSHGVRLLHLSWYGLDWAELNHGVEVRGANGYTKSGWLSGHKALIDVGIKLSSKDLAVELPLSGYGPLSSGESDELAAHVVSKLGADSDRFFIQANGWNETQQWGAPDMQVESQFDRIWNRPVARGVQMIQPDGYDWAKVFDQAVAADATYGEVYLPSFWQTPGPTAQYNHNTTARIAQLEKEVAAFAKANC
ncbi:MAG: hypothetical protein WBP61_12570 [Nocardioides sp.]